MPTYEYLCQTCSHRFETWQKMTDEPLTTCPECGSHIRRVFYPAGLVFKGSGFYKTDHGNGISPASNNHSGDGAGESKATSESKASENGTGAKSSQNGSSAKPSESSTSTAGVK